MYDNIHVHVCMYIVTVCVLCELMKSQRHGSRLTQNTLLNVRFNYIVCPFALPIFNDLCKLLKFSLQECLSSCHSLSVLYLYNNSIHCVEGLTSCCNLTHLYLQNNHISRLEGLSTLNRLSKLYDTIHSYNVT